MLSLSDFDSKKIIVIKNKGDIEENIKFHNSNLLVFDPISKKKSKIPCHMIFVVFIIGDFTITTRIMKHFKEMGISLFILNRSFKPMLEIVAVAEGNYILRKLQYDIDEATRFKYAKKIVKNKIENQARLLEEYKQVLEEVSTHEIKLNMSTKNKTILGIEGYYSKVYFGKLFEKYDWMRRAPTTREDINNFLLDIGYTFLFNFCDSCLRIFGFDTYVGFYHRLFFQRKSLACDVMEPFRVIIDKALIKAYRLKRIDKKDFKFRNGMFEFKSIEASYKYTGIFFQAINKYKNDIYQYVIDLYRHIGKPYENKFPEFIYYS